MPTDSDEQTSSAARITASNLRVDAITAEVLRGLEAAGAQSLLLKGASVTRWLSTSDNPRIYLDCDLLVRPEDQTSTEQALRALDFDPAVEQAEMPAWWREHSMTWMRAADSAKVDLHRTIEGVGVEPARLWLALSKHVERIDVAGYTAQTLTIPARALHLALHAAQHGVEWDRPLADLELAISVTDERTWEEAAALARALEAMPAFATGLRLTAAGRALADRLGLSDEQSVEVALRAGAPPPVALGLDQLARAKTLRARLTILRYKLVPPPSFMRHWWPPARRGRTALALAYLWRPLWLIARLPAGFKAWRQARRKARLSRSRRP